MQRALLLAALLFLAASNVVHAIEVPQSRTEFIDAVAAGARFTRVETIIVEQNFTQVYALLEAKSSICLDVLIHQPTKTDYEGLLARLIALARKRLLVSGYNQPPWHTSAITFFYESLAESLIRLAPGATLSIVGGYRDLTILCLDLPESAVASQTIPGSRLSQ